MMEVFGLFNYWDFAILLMTGLYTVIAKTNLVKRRLGTRPPRTP